MKIPYEEIDPNIINLVKAFNEYPGITTTSSCGGHPNNKNYQKPEGEWDVFLELNTYNDTPTEQAWLSIELLAYTFTKVFFGTGMRVVSSNPFLNGFGDSMSFVVEGNENPDEVASHLRHALKELERCQEE